MHELFRAIHVGDEEEIEKAARKEIENFIKMQRRLDSTTLLPWKS